jgi:hypothetical protein
VRWSRCRCSGYVGPDAKARPRRAGFDLYLGKPVDLEALPGILVNVDRAAPEG